MSDVIFRLNEQELDRMLEEARPELQRAGISIVDGSARDALVWAISFSADRPVGSDARRIATTITLNDDAPLAIQTVAISPRLTHRIPQQSLPWPELRRRGLAGVVIETLNAAQRELQVRIGVDFAYEELARRCDRLLDLIGDEVPNAELLRQRVAKWRDSSLARSLYSRARTALVTEFGFGHLDDDLRSLDEFYEQNIFRPLTEPPPAQGAGWKPALHEDQDEDREHSRRPAVLDSIAKAAETSSSGEPVNAVGIVLLIAAIAVVVTGIVRISWWTIGFGAIFLVLVIRAMLQWRR